MKILVVDDHPSTAAGTKTLLEQESDMQVTFALSIKDAIAAVTDEQFDVMLLDLNMPEMSGIELTRRIVLMRPEAVVLIYSGYDYIPYFNALIEAGACGFISKTNDREKLVQIIRHAVRGQALIPIRLLKQLRREHTMVAIKSELELHDISISSREQAVLYEAAKGKSNKDIADDLHVSIRTVESTLTSIYQKLGAVSRVEAVGKAKQFGILPDNIDM